VLRSNHSSACTVCGGKGKSTLTLLRTIRAGVGLWFPRQTLTTHRTSVTNPAVGCHYFLPGPWVTIPASVSLPLTGATLHYMVNRGTSVWMTCLGSVCDTAEWPGIEPASSNPMPYYATLHGDWTSVLGNNSPGIIPFSSTYWLLTDITSILILASIFSCQWLCHNTDSHQRPSGHSYMIYTCHCDQAILLVSNIAGSTLCNCEVAYHLQA